MSEPTYSGSTLNKYEKLERDLHLKQLQIRSLLAITQAINDNISASALFNMYKSFLSWEMGVEKMALLIKQGDGWTQGASINVDYPVNKKDLLEILSEFKRLHTISSDETHPILKEFDVVLPVLHKEIPLAYTMIGGFKDQSDIYSKIQFITTITNIVAVAIENKRLFKKQLEQERFKKAMELAEEVQQMLIPESFPNQTPGFQIDSIYKPHYNVGGDYFDYFYFNPKVFAFCIADISGKGVAAALLMANFQAVLRSTFRIDTKLDELTKDLNTSVYQITKSDKFISFFIARINLETRTMEYVNAGHCPPCLHQEGKTQNLTEGCAILGASDKVQEITVGSINLSSTSFLVAYTDGLTDLRNEEGAYFDEDHLQVFLLTNQHLSAKNFNKLLLKRLERFKGKQAFPDDIAIVSCKIDSVEESF